MNEDYDSFKLLLLGDVAVGKTCIFLKFSENTFDEDQISTIGFDYRRKIIAIDETQKICLTIWDTAGQEKFKSITKNYYKGANGILIIYDVTNKQSFLGIEEWIKTINESASSDIQLMIIGNKVDLDERVINTKEGQELATKYNCEFLETSAKKNINITETFDKLIQKMIDNKSKIKLKEEQFRLLQIEKRRHHCCGKTH